MSVNKIGPIQFGRCLIAQISRVLGLLDGNEVENGLTWLIAVQNCFGLKKLLEVRLAVEKTFVTVVSIHSV